MSWCNNFTPPVAHQYTDEELYGSEPYDINFVFPIDTSLLENDRIKLTPYVPRLHAAEFFKVMDTNKQLTRFLPLPELRSQRDLLVFFEDYRKTPENVLFIIIDKTRPPASGVELPGFEGGSFAGVIAYIRTSGANLCTEIGYVVIFPEFQRTHVLTNAAGLMLRYCLNRPTDSPPGLGLRRVQWCANTRNAPSIRAAERLQFKREATTRWDRALPEGKEGNTPRPSDPYPEKLGRDTATLTICWDDWENGARNAIEKLMERTS